MKKFHLTLVVWANSKQQTANSKRPERKKERENYYYNYTVAIRISLSVCLLLLPLHTNTRSTAGTNNFSSFLVCGNLDECHVVRNKERTFFLFGFMDFVTLEKEG